MTKATKTKTVRKSEPLEPATTRKQSPRFTNGGPAGPGRPKGKPNKTTILLRDAIAAVFVDLQEEEGGGHKHMLKWARENPTEYYRIAARHLPVTIESDGDAIGLVVFRGIHDHV
jgi:hypothetical protein